MFHTKWMHIFHATHYTDANSGTIELFKCVIVCWTINHLAAILKTTLFGKNEKFKTFANFIFFRIKLLYASSAEDYGLQFALVLK